MIAAAIANNGIRGFETPIKPSDFPFDLLQDIKPPRKKRINRKKIADEIRNNFSRFRLIHADNNAR